MELNLKILAPLLQCTSIFRCALFMKAKKKKIILFIPPIKKSFLSLSHSVPLSLSQITQLSFTLPNHSQSVPLFLSQITPPLPNHPSSSSHSFDLAVPRPQITHRRSSLTVMLSLSSLTPLLTGFDCFVVVLRWVFVVVLRWISWLCSDGFLWLCSGEFHGCEIGFVG